MPPKCLSVPFAWFWTPQVRQHESRWSAILSISSKIGCAPQTLKEWVKKAEVDRGDRAGITTEMAVSAARSRSDQMIRGDHVNAQNALAETINGLFKAEVIHRRGPWRNFEAVEYATLEWVDWFNNRRLLEPIGNIPPAEAEANFYAALETEAMAA